MENENSAFKKKRFLSPSLLSADFSDLSSAVKFIEEKKASFVHIDVMDGHFVPQISYGQPVISSLRKTTKLPFDVHLMIEKPENFIPSFIDSGADFVTFHAEATCHADRCIQLIREKQKRAGIALCPATPVSAVEEILPFVDLVLVMTVNPGWGGQKMIPYTIEKVKKLADIQREKRFNYLISVDGGVNQETLKSVIEAGTDIVVSGSSFFRGNLEWN
jgi:ribulose-phosphate 3-epimerase